MNKQITITMIMTITFLLTMLSDLITHILFQPPVGPKPGVATTLAMILCPILSMSLGSLFLVRKKNMFWKQKTPDLISISVKQCKKRSCVCTMFDVKQMWVVKKSNCRCSNKDDSCSKSANKSSCDEVEKCQTARSRIFDLNRMGSTSSPVNWDIFPKNPLSHKFMFW